MKNAINKIKNISYFEEKRRFLLFVVVLFFVLLLAIYLFRFSYARYETGTKIKGNIEKAIYILGVDDSQMSFNLDTNGIVPRNEDYVYSFTISNFKDDKVCDVDISYDLTVTTTTNLPLTYKLYRNQTPSQSGAVDLISGGAVKKQDADGAWYRIYKDPNSYTMNYTTKTTDTYTLVVNFPAIYKEDTTYANYIENIEIKVESKQIV